jgi:REP element-mobilizing transposase RayT
MNRGDQREDIFLDQEDRRCFLATLEQACIKTAWQVHAYCLMSNHFHLVVETPRPNLVAGMKWLSGVYTKRFNIRHKLCGHLLAGRYQALVVEGSGNGYLRTVCDYVHLNPVRAGLLAAEAPLQSYGWSSYPSYLMAPEQRPVWLRVDRLLGEKGIPRDSEAGRQQLALEMERRRAEEAATDHTQIRRSWFLGSETFRQELLAAATQRVGPSQYGSERHETEQQKAERIVAGELAAWGWTEWELEARSKGHPQKVKLASRLRMETTLSLKEIAARLHMGSWTYVSNLLRTAPPSPAQPQTTLPLCQ